MAVAPVWGRGLKSQPVLQLVDQTVVAPVWGRGLKLVGQHPSDHLSGVAPVWGRGLKLPTHQKLGGQEMSPPYGGVD